MKKIAFNGRVAIVRSGLYLLALVILCRLVYWQVIKHDELRAEAQEQRRSVEQVFASRGDIITSDGYALVSNKPNYLLYAYLPQITEDPSRIAQSLTPLLLTEPKNATEAAIPVTQRMDTIRLNLLDRLNATDRSWVPLARNVTAEQKEQIESLQIVGLGFDQGQKRHYPEASMSAHILGIVGSDEAGTPTGYFGLEGAYNLELQGKPGEIIQEKDAIGRPILIGLFDQNPERNGRTLKLHINRSLQYLVESYLKEGIATYEAKSGEVILMDPFTGAILAMASFPSYDPANFIEYDPVLYKNPIIANTYEPGSTFKVVVMAAGIDAGKVTPQTQCFDPCSGPVQIGKYSIRTWNNVYNPGLTMTEVLENSDNTGMIYVANKLGKDTFLEYLRKFGFGEQTGIDLQEEVSSSLRENWSEIDLATTSFGQGIAVTGIQMVTSVAAIANGGYLVTPQVVDTVFAEKELPIEPVIKRQVISKETAQQVTEMMQTAARHGEAQWTVLEDYSVAGKTGTAQIPIDGHYDAEKTIASFVGFAPADNPRFVMLVKLTEPQSSPWAAETAAPLWYKIAKDVLIHLNVPPDRRN